MRRHWQFVVLTAIVGLLFVGLRLDAATPEGALPGAHAHNDYLHPRPLLDALDQGFTSVEADIFLVKGELLVAHNFSDVDRARSLKGLYLDPLRERVKAHGGSVHGDGQPFQLLIDIKTNGKAAYAALGKLLGDYADVVSRVEAGKAEPKAVNVVISGDRPREVMVAERVRYAGYDGRLSDLDSDASPNFLPLISDHWGTNFKWKGQGAMTEADREKLRGIVARAHARGRQVRFWAVPDNADAWREMRSAGVDWINTDNLAGLAAFLRSPAGRN